MSKSPAAPQQKRKTPKQSRSQQMRRDLLAGATRVLHGSGAAGFSTNRVAEATGVSIGSLYQYYPNKGALLSDLHAVQATEVFEQLRVVLKDSSLAPRERLMRVILGAFAAQAAGTEHHTALRNAGVPNEHALPMTEFTTHVEHEFSQFFAEALPKRAAEAPVLAAFTVEVVFGLLGRMAENPARDWCILAEHSAHLLVAHAGFDPG
jgi:AcrR family transcriptional regulator